MSTSTPQSAPPHRAFHAPEPPETSIAPASPRRRVRWYVPVLAVMLLFGLAAIGVSQWSNLVGGDDVSTALTHTVSPGNLLITVTEDGNVESSSNVDIRCEVSGGSMIISIVPDGTHVKMGDELVRLDTSLIEEQVNAQKIVYERALAARIQAEKEFSAAKIALQEYLEGTYVQELQLAEGNITIALENMRSAQNALQHTQRMARKGYVTALQRDAQEFAVRRAQLDLDAAETAKTVLEKFTKQKMVEDLESARDSAEARMRSEQASFDLEKAKLDRLSLQLEKSVIYAPQDGMVVYANEQGGRFGGQQQSGVEEGATVRERQTIIRLPDLSRMQVKVTVHESKIDSLRPGMRAIIRIQDREFQGTVVSLANQPEPNNFFAPNVKEYATIVRVDGGSSDVKPGMTAEVEILLASLKGVLTVPVQAVVEQGGQFYCWVQTSQGPERRPLVIGRNNDIMIEIKDGVAEGDRVLLNPRALVAEAREEASIDDGADAAERFGSSSDATAAEESPAAPTTGRGEEARPAGREASPSGRSGGEGRPAGQRGGGSMDLMQFDVDGDKKVSRDEAPEQMQNFFDRLDGDGDGFIDAKEIAAIRSRAQQRQGGEGPSRADGAEGGASDGPPGRP